LWNSEMKEMYELQREETVRRGEFEMRTITIDEVEGEEDDDEDLIKK